jgi:hypothetical protein
MEIAGTEAARACLFALQPSVRRTFFTLAFLHLS